MVYKQDSYFCKYFDLKILEIFWSLFNISHSQLARNNHHEKWLYWGRKKCPFLIFCFHYSKKSIIYTSSLDLFSPRFYQYQHNSTSILSESKLQIILKTISIVLHWSCNIKCYSCFWILLECKFHEDERFCCCLVHTRE